MGQCLGKPSGSAEERYANMSQAKTSELMAKAIATKMDRIPDMDRDLVWSPEEVEALGRMDQPWASLEDDPMGLRFEYPTSWQLCPPQRSGTRFDRIVRTAHVLYKNHMRPSGELAVGFAHFNNQKPKDPITFETFITFNDKMTTSASGISGCKLLSNETLPAGAFKGSTHPVVHNVMTFSQTDGTTSRVEQWMLLSRDRTTFAAVTIFNSDLPCYDKYRPIQDRWLQSVRFADGHF